MTTIRLIVAVVLCGLAMFFWTSLAHMALPLGHAGIRELPNEQKVLTSLQTDLGNESALYLFPGLGAGENPTREQEKQAMEHYAEKLASNPSGVLIYHPAGSRPLAFGKSLAIEFVTEFLETLLVLFLLLQTRITSFGGRVGFVFVAGILAAIATNVSYWNWYGFPTTYTVCYMLIQMIGFLCVGLVAGLVFPRRQID